MPIRSAGLYSTEWCVNALCHLSSQSTKPMFIDRLGEVVAGTGGAEALDLRGSGVSAHHHDRESCRRGFGAQLAKDFVSLNIGQVQIEQDEIRPLLGPGLG
ncbi:MAG: hypothetical protein QOE70_5800 [Chthoniobacter sp.]|jgi:hypothetical protein|nr:hypothetical protein [Chthoniobacter sp.]